uniref:Uncharacterized protein n=2 Tax=Cupriavidus taiwanensis TaxID=164546 RepID=A0A375HFN0_9BURK|nr:protein of unknown function [Cupriavidus taiwanensis]
MSWPLPAHLRQVEHHHEPEDTHCPTPGGGRTIVRVGEDVSEKLDTVPAESFCTATSMASGPADAANAWYKSQLNHKSSTAAYQQLAWSRTR